ncbi:hypothetical protein Pla100_22220 [Neorhodopirellula pilleata]|uniref:Uncharacterized protein n=1 Tax=Neorhodopirellula pilleata TaxID=2714738 RepID=A0A5C6AIH6_9BACT|nr:hypothetical protein Pla100_22220 [Neorhodopirellula pilleata]
MDRSFSIRMPNWQQGWRALRKSRVWLFIHPVARFWLFFDQEPCSTGGGFV